MNIIRKTKDYKGITLVALIVTIVILLILAGISIAQLTKYILFEKAKITKEKSTIAQKDEEAKLSDYETIISKHNGSSRDELSWIENDAKKLLSITSDPISLSDVVNSEKIMEKIMKQNETTDLCLSNSNIRNAILNSDVALNFTVRLNQILSTNNITLISDNQYKVSNGDKVRSNAITPYSNRYSYGGFDGKYVNTSGSWPYDFSCSGSSEYGKSQGYYLIYEFNEPVFAFKFKYQVSHNSSTSGNRKYAVQASNDGNNWISLTETTEHSGKRWVDTCTQKVIYTQENVNKYKMFRLITLEASGEDCGESAIGEFEIFGIK